MMGSSLMYSGNQTSVIIVILNCFAKLFYKVKLAEVLEQEGADIIQTEGGKYSSPSKPGVLGLIEKVRQQPTISRGKLS